MRQFFLGLCAGLFLVSGAAAQSLRVVTWQADDFPSVPSGAGQNDPDVKRLRLVAAALKPHEADAIVLEGMPDRNTCTRLASFLKPVNYQVVQFNTFRGSSNVPVARSIAVLARKSLGAARTVDWRSSGQLDAAGGFNFSTLTAGTNTFCLYVAQFVDAAGARTNTRLAQLNARKRELAAQYLLHHTKWLEASLTNGHAAFLALGNLADGLALWPGDTSAQILEQAGFRGNPLVPASEPAAHPYPQLFARDADYDGAPQLSAPKGFGTGPVLYQLVVKPPPAPAPVVAAIPPVVAVKGAAGPASKSLPVDERFLWLAAPVAGALCLFFLILLPYRWLSSRRQSRALVPARPANNAVLVDFATPSDADPALEAGRAAGQIADSPGAAWEERARKAEDRAHQATAVVREGLMPQFVRMMREKILQRLSSQRAHLIDSHVAGTMQVLELEERLEKIQSQFQARLTAREQRVAELEKELAAKDNFIRELLKAQAGKSVNQ